MKGKTVAILESRLGEQLVSLISRRGWQPLHAPALSEQPDVDPDAIRALVEQWPARAPRLVIFQTGVGVRALFEATDTLGLSARFLEQIAGSTVVVRGPKPTAVLRARGVRIDRNAAGPYTTREVLDAIEDVPLQGERVLVQRYGDTNIELERALTLRGATVIEIPTYRWSLPADTAPLVRLMDALGRGEVDAAVFTSASQVLNLFGHAVKLGRAEEVRIGLGRVTVASIGPVCSDALRRAGVPVALEASPPKLGPLITALAQHLGYCPPHPGPLPPHAGGEGEENH
ncbi:MAG TPA: uroporphyrinogen-III synthase [Burkholderiales bacterium]|nr:uroporphyrinogen-III synthase [Burkholderiales bacterium]